MKVQLADGTVVEGTSEQIKSVMEALGVKGTAEVYFSASKGPIAISNMHTLHIKNAAIKEYRSWLDKKLATAPTPRKFVALFAGGPNTPLMRGFLKELHVRDPLSW